MDVTDKNSEEKYHLWGWILFVICAGFFIASSIKSGDYFGLAGSFVFLLACIVFIIPLITKRNRNTEG